MEMFREYVEHVYLHFRLWFHLQDCIDNDDIVEYIEQIMLTLLPRLDDWTDIMSGVA